MKKAAVIVGMTVLAAALSGCGQKTGSEEIASLSQQMENLQATVDSIATEVGNIRTAQESAWQADSQDIILGGEDDSETDAETADDDAADLDTAESANKDSDQIKAMNEKITSLEKQLDSLEKQLDKKSGTEN